MQDLGRNARSLLSATRRYGRKIHMDSYSSMIGVHGCDIQRELHCASRSAVEEYLVELRFETVYRK
eukprot:3715564-Rhodomonas_salina.1